MNKLHTRELYPVFMRNLNVGLESFLNNALDVFDYRLPAQQYSWSPRVDIHEEEGGYRVAADIPGIPAGEIDVSVQDGKITIKGERKSERTENNNGYLRTERLFGSFIRQIQLPPDADQNAVTAKSKDGVLEIVIGKKETARQAKIEVLQE